jgi:predicted lipoprotein
LSESVAVAKLGKPLGLATGGDPQPELEESGPSDNSLADMVSNLHSIRNVYFGTRSGLPGSGIDRLVTAQSPATHRAVVEALDGAVQAIEGIPRPFSTAVEEHQAEVQRAYDAVKVLQRVLATEVVAVLGATLQFNDNDGD